MSWAVKEERKRVVGGRFILHDPCARLVTIWLSRQTRKRVRRNTATSHQHQRSSCNAYVAPPTHKCDHISPTRVGRKAMNIWSLPVFRFSFALVFGSINLTGCAHKRSNIVQPIFALQCCFTQIGNVLQQCQWFSAPKRLQHEIFSSLKEKSHTITTIALQLVEHFQNGGTGF